MSVRVLLVSVGLFVTCGAFAQPPKASPVPPRIDLPVPPPPPAEQSVDDLLAAIEQLRARKAELEKQEQELTAALRKRLDAQTERLKKLGIAPKEAKEPDRVGRIIIEGNEKTPDQKILVHLDFRPGQVLKYPALEEARRRLEKAGFRDAVVEVIPNELDDTFKDIRVRIVEDKR